MKVSYETQLEMLLDSIEKHCPHLSRLSLVLPSDEKWKIGKEEFTSRFLRLCEKLTSLVALFAYFRVPFGHCDETNSMLEERFEEERPALRAEIASPVGKSESTHYGDGLDMVEYEYQPKLLSVMHSDILVRCESQVAVFPINYQPFFQCTF